MLEDIASDTTVVVVTTKHSACGGAETPTCGGCALGLVALTGGRGCLVHVPSA